MYHRLFYIICLIFSLSLAPPVHAEDSLPWADTESPLQYDDDDFFSELEAEYGAAPVINVADPLETFNRGMFAINDRLYFWVLQPAATGWRAVAPSPVRTGIRNAFHNISTPIRVVNQLLQGKGKAALAETGKFFVNSIWGVFGLIDASQQIPSLQVPPEDLGLTLAHWGVGNGFYIVLPIVGPSTLRDVTGRVGDFFLNPTSYTEWQAITRVGVNAWETTNATSFRLGAYEAVQKASLDPYIAIRNGYIQLRNKNIAR